MAQKPETSVHSVNSQAANRWVVTVYDQHKCPRFPRGRPFWGYVEYPAEKQMDALFVQEMMPGDTNDPMNSSWGAPWMPPQTIAATGRSTFRLNMKRDQLTWNYGTVISDDTIALQNYYEAAAKIAYQKGWDAPNFGQAVSFQILTILGYPPRSPKIAEAASAGDPWILGFTDQVNEELAQLLKPGRMHTGGTRVVQNLVPTLTPAQVLDPQADIAKMIADAVQAALAVERATQAVGKPDKMAAARAAKAAKKGPQAVATGA